MEIDYDNESLMQDPAAVRERVGQLLAADVEASRKRYVIDAMFDGNAPFSRSELRRLGIDKTNISFGEARAMRLTAESAFYDLFHEAPTYATCLFDGDPVVAEVITEEFQKFNKNDRSLDPMFQRSIRQMVTHGAGALVFNDPAGWQSESLWYRQLLVPKNAAADTSKWQEAVVLMSYKVHEMWQFIENRKSAAMIGWQVDEVEKAIQRAAIPPQIPEPQQAWEHVQDQLRRNAFTIGGKCKEVRVAYYYHRERDGRISLSIVPREENQSDGFLFRRTGYYDSWDCCIHPFYLNTGDGTHAGVKGLGVMIYSLCQLLDRIQCMAADHVADLLSTMIQVADSDNYEKARTIRIGTRTILPMGVNYVARNDMAGRVAEAKALEQSIRNLLLSNTSQFRTSLQMPKSGNPLTAEEVRTRAQMEATLQKTDQTRYYEQLDYFWRERFRRLTFAMDNKAKQFRTAVADRLGLSEIPRKIWDAVHVKATRVAGQGSSMLRVQMMERYLTLFGSSLPERSRIHLMDDLAAALFGRDLVPRYSANPSESPPGIDEWMAGIENAGFKEGTTPVLSPAQNHLVHVQSHTMFLSQALASVQQGADPTLVLAALQTGIPHLEQTLQLLAADPLRAPTAALFASLLSQLKAGAAQLLQIVKSQQRQQQKTQQVLTDEQIELMKAKGSEQRLNAKMQQQLINKQQKHQLEMQQRRLDMELKAMEARLKQLLMVEQLNRTQQTTGLTQPGSMG
jgi:hypothetical protein